MTDATWLFLDRLSMLLGIITGVITLLALLVGYINRERVRRWLTRNRFPAVGGELQNGERLDGIVFTISRAETPHFVIDQVKPRMVSLICTKESRVAAADVAKAAEAAGITVRDVHEIIDPDHPEETRRAAATMLVSLRESGCHLLAVDLTGGKTPMSLGAFMAAEENAATSLYVASAFDTTLKAPIMRTAHIVRISKP